MPKKTATKTRPKRPVKQHKVPATAVPLIASFMTKAPHTIGRDQTLAVARKLMNAHRIRHLPVLDGGRLVGVLSQRDLYFIESLDNSPADDIRVDEAMSTEVSETSADATLEQVVARLVRKKHGCAVVTAGGRVVGLFSTIDAMNALLQYLRAEPAPADGQCAPRVTSIRALSPCVRGRA